MYVCICIVSRRRPKKLNLRACMCVCVCVERERERERERARARERERERMNCTCLGVIYHDGGVDLCAGGVGAWRRGREAQDRDLRHRVPTHTHTRRDTDNGGERDGRRKERETPAENLARVHTYTERNSRHAGTRTRSGFAWGSRGGTAATIAHPSRRNHPRAVSSSMHRWQTKVADF
jgi:hypothetical protein